MTLFADNSKNKPSHIIPVDTEHLGIRLFVPITTVASLVGGYLLGGAILQAIVPTASVMCLGIPMAIIVAAIALQFVDKVVKPRWTSGRHIVHDHQLTLVDNRRGKNKEIVFNWMQPLDYETWYFEIATKRKSRVPQGWYCTSLRLVQDNHVAIIYTFMSPDKARELTGFNDKFTLLQRQEKSGGLSQSSVKKSAMQLSAQQKRLRQYENERWEDGAEVASEDFAQIIADVVLNARPTD